MADSDQSGEPSTEEPSASLAREPARGPAASTAAASGVDPAAALEDAVREQVARMYALKQQHAANETARRSAEAATAAGSSEDI